MPAGCRGAGAGCIGTVPVRPAQRPVRPGAQRAGKGRQLQSCPDMTKPGRFPAGGHGAPGETRTHTGRVLNPLPLPIGLLGRVKKAAEGCCWGQQTGKHPNIIAHRRAPAHLRGKTACQPVCRGVGRPRGRRVWCRPCRTPDLITATANGRHNDASLCRRGRDQAEKPFPVHLPGRDAYNRVP